MIIKNKETISSKSVRQIAGEKQEQDVAFFLRRAYKDDPKVYVFNDLRFEYNDEVAQIDHLILYPYGFVLIESKSITGEVKVNKEQEWTRSYNKQWSGIRSPIKQVELQEKLLRELLYENKEKMLPTKLFGVLQESFGHRCWDNLCAISSNAIVHRDEMPKLISKKLVKSEFAVDKLNKLMNIPANIITNTLKFDTRPAFSTEQMNNISDFLIQQHKPVGAENPQQIPPEPIAIKSEIKIEPPTTISTLPLNKLCCKKCNNTEQLQGAWGKFGYYVKCPSCGTNTSMKQNCPDCGSKNTKISKKKAHYQLICQDCNASNEVFVQTE